MIPIVFHSNARAELDEAIAYYEKQRGGLGLGLLAEVEKATQRIQRSPTAFPMYQATAFRSCAVRRFPYWIFYLTRDDAIWVVAVAHHKRKPGYWKRREVGQ